MKFVIHKFIGSSAKGIVILLNQCYSNRKWFKLEKLFNFWCQGWSYNVDCRISRSYHLLFLFVSHIMTRCIN